MAFSGTTFRSACRSAMGSIISSVRRDMPKGGASARHVMIPDSAAATRLNPDFRRNCGKSGGCPPEGSVCLGALDALAQRHADEAGDLDRRPDQLGRLGQTVADLDVAIDEIRQRALVGLL